MFSRNVQGLGLRVYGAGCRVDGQGALSFAFVTADPQL